MIILLLLCIIKAIYCDVNSSVNHSTLLTFGVEYLIEHNLFTNILHPISLYEPVLFNSVVHKMLAQKPAFNFGQYFLRTATKDIFDSYIVFDADIKHNYSVNANEVWKLLKMIDNSWLFDLNNFKFTFTKFDINGDNKFHFITNISSNMFNLEYSQNARIDKINWSEIPNFLVSITATYTSEHYIQVDLSSFDQSSEIRTLSLSINNGTIIPTDYSLPSSLKTLELINFNGKAMHWQRLWKVCSNVETLRIYQKYTNLTDFDGFGEMKKLKLLIGNFEDGEIRRVAMKIHEEYTNSLKQNKSQIIKRLCIQSSIISVRSINIQIFMEPRISIQQIEDEMENEYFHDFAMILCILIVLVSGASISTALLLN